MQLSPPPSPTPSFSPLLFFPSLPASHSCCLGEPALVQEEAAFPCKAQGQGQLLLLQPASGKDGEGMAKWGCQHRQRLSTPAFGGKAQLCGLGLTWLARHCSDWGGVGKGGCRRLSASPLREVLKIVKKEGFFLSCP